MDELREAQLQTEMDQIFDRINTILNTIKMLDPVIEETQPENED